MDNQAVPQSPEAVANAPVKPPLVKKFAFGSRENLVLVGISLLVVLAGAITGWFLTGTAKKGSTSSMAISGVKQTQNEAGMSDESTFRDTATGVLEEGGISGEGTHHLVRDGGPDQYVYLTSTIIDLESFKGKKVQVWGETVSAKKAGWLMDVGKIKVVE
jgi:hypothetical protein